MWYNLPVEVARKISTFAWPISPCKHEIHDAYMKSCEMFHNIMIDYADPMETYTYIPDEKYMQSSIIFLKKALFTEGIDIMNMQDPDTGQVFFLYYGTN